MSDMVFVLCCQRSTFLFMAVLRLNLKVSSEPLTLIIVLLMRVVTFQGCVMDTKHTLECRLCVCPSAFSDLALSLSNQFKKFVCVFLRIYIRLIFRLIWFQMIRPLVKSERSHRGVTTVDLLVVYVCGHRL